MTPKDWGAGGIYSRALNAGVVVLVGGLAGQSGGKIVADAAGPSVSKAVGDIGTGLADQATKDVLKYVQLAEEAKAKNDAAAADA
jgi:filamentous hemagglutinin